MLNSMLEKLKTAFLAEMPDGEHYEPTPVALQRSIVEQPRLSGLLPYTTYLENEQLFETEDGLGFCIEIGTQTGASQETAEVLSALLTNCPTNTGVQIMLYG
ncbi:MAG: TraC family protein, partial [Gammaproteobacteria bacterium]|nr:TraC family protein [Gammaproteobacteria bacterium]